MTDSTSCRSNHGYRPCAWRQVDRSGHGLDLCTLQSTYISLSINYKKHLAVVSIKLYGLYLLTKPQPLPMTITINQTPITNCALLWNLGLFFYSKCLYIFIPEVIQFFPNIWITQHRDFIIYDHKAKVKGKNW